MTVTIEILHQSALELLRKLESEHKIRMQPSSVPVDTSYPERKFEAITIDTRGYSFNRQQANER